MKCKWCGEEFEQQRGTQKYCDKVCQQEFHKQNQRNETIRKRNIPKTTICVHCGKDFVVTRGNQKFCSEDCKEKANEIRKSLKKSGTQKPTPTSKQDDVDPWEALANAIVIQAINDYRQSKDVLKYEPYNDIEKGKVKHIEKFIQSEYFKAITNLNPDMLLKKLRSE